MTTPLKIIYINMVYNGDKEKILKAYNKLKHMWHNSSWWIKLNDAVAKMRVK